MIATWSGRRKTIYALGTIFFVVATGVYLSRDILFPAPTCFDKKQNGFESGVDCGGACSLKCKEQVIPLSISWSRALPTASSTYDFVALVSNKNVDNAPKEMLYLFTAYDAEGNGFFTREGKTKVPVDGDFPLVAQNIFLKEAPASIGVQLKPNTPHFKVLEKPTMPTIRVSGTKYEAGSIPRVYANVTNTKRLPISNLPVRVVLFDADGNAYGTGETIIPTLGKEETKSIVFTWNSAFKDAPTKVRIFPILDPFLGSI